MDSIDDFYAQLPSFRQFSDLVDDSHYTSVPPEWFVIVTDVKGSTKAIEAGRYKDVNQIGVASIVTTQNAMGALEFPFVFGGDGATFLIPPSKIAVVKQQLAGLKNISETQFELELRVGIVNAGELIRDGGVINVAKYEVIRGQSIAMFRGGGLTLAEDLIKNKPDDYNVPADANLEPDLTGLSCRWQPVKTRKGVILSLLAMARGESPFETYKEILHELNNILQEHLDQSSPIHSDKMEYKGILQCIKDERRYYDSPFSISFLKRVAEIFIAVSAFKFNLPLFDHKKYAASMRTHADFRKFDDMLRMVIDCTDKDVEGIECYLSQLHASGRLYFGLHQSDTSLMTCFVQSIEPGDHLHFVDGGDGGYAMAAKQLKSQIKGQS